MQHNVMALRQLSGDVRTLRGSCWLQAVLGEVVLVAYLFAVTYWRPYMARADNFLAIGSLFGTPRACLPGAPACCAHGLG